MKKEKKKSWFDVFIVKFIGWNINQYSKNVSYFVFNCNHNTNFNTKLFCNERYRQLWTLGRSTICFGLAQAREHWTERCSIIHDKNNTAVSYLGWMFFSNEYKHIREGIFAFYFKITRWECKLRLTSFADHKMRIFFVGRFEKHSNIIW